MTGGMEVTDPERGAWLRAVTGDGRRPDHLVPSGYPAAIRVLHEPALVRELGLARTALRITWQQAAVLLGQRVEPGVTWAMLTGSDEDRTPLGPGLDLVVPEEGRLPAAVLASVVRTLTGGRDVRLTAGVWVGWAELHPRSLGLGAVAAEGTTREDLEAFLAARTADIEAEPTTPVQEAIAAGRTLELPNRELVLLVCDAAELLDPAWVRTAGLGWTSEADLPTSRGPATPNLLWPDDRSWFLTSEIDDPYTTVVGPEPLIDALADDRLLETMRIPAPRRG